MLGFSIIIARPLTYLAHLLILGRGQLFHAHVGIDDDAPIRNCSGNWKDMWIIPVGEIPATV